MPRSRCDQGERISSDHVIARTDPRHLAVRIAIADQLGVAHRGSEVHAPAGWLDVCRRRGDGQDAEGPAQHGGGRADERHLLALDHDNGVGLLAPGAGGDVRSLVAGDVEYVDGHQSVAIRTVGSRMFGIVGVGPSAEGKLVFAVSSPGEVAQPDRITSDMAKCVVVVGSSILAVTLRRLIDVGAVGVISGGIVERDVSACFVVATDDRLSPWRIGPSDTGMGDNMRPRSRSWQLKVSARSRSTASRSSFLRQVEGRKVTIITTTRTSGFLARPQIVHVSEDALDDEAPGKPVTLSAETRLRLVDQAELGISGAVAEMPRRIQRADGSTSDVMLVSCVDGKTRSVALNNIEIIA